MVTDAPAFFRSRRHAATSGHVPNIAQTPSADGLAQSETRRAFQGALLLARRKALISTVRHLRRQHRAVSLAMAELRAVTHAILAQGEK